MLYTANPIQSTDINRSEAPKKPMKGKLPRTKCPKLRAWGKPSRKVMTMVIPSKKDKLAKREAQKELLRKELEENENKRT